MKKWIVSCLLLLTSQVFARDTDGRYVYYEPDLTASSAPFSFPDQRRVKVDRCSCEQPKKRTLTYRRRVVYEPASYNYETRVVRRDCREPRNCKVYSNIVKEINGGSPKFVVNGSYKVCNEPVQNRNLTENFGWNWVRNVPYYMKDPVYLQERSDLRRFTKTETTVQTKRDPAENTYFYR